MKRWKMTGVLVLVAAGALIAAPTVRAWWTGQREDRGMRLEFFNDGAGGEIGASVRDVEQADLDRARLTTRAGVVVDDVTSESPAAGAGLKSGDVILEFDGERVRSARQLIRLVRETPIGRRVKTVVQRDGARLDLEIAPREQERASWSGRRFNGSLADLDGIPDLHDLDIDFGGDLSKRGRLGVTVDDLTPQLAQYFGAKNGVLVSSVREDDSPAAKAGLKAGDVITAVNQKPVRDRRDLLRALGDIDKGGEATLEVVRDKKVLVLKAQLTDAGSERERRARPGRAV